MDYVFNNARSSTGDINDIMYENLRNIQRLLVINQYDNKHYHFALKSFHESRLYCEYQHYHNILTIKKSFIYFIRIDRQQHLLQSSTFDEMNIIMNENIIDGIIPEEQSLQSLFDILSLIYNHLLPPIIDQSLQNSSKENISERDQLRSSLNRFSLQIQSTLRQMQGEFTLTIPSKNLLIISEETEEEYIENLEYLLYDWEGILHEEMNNELNKRIIQSNPLAEIEFWHERSIRLTSILEQMKRGYFCFVSYFLFLPYRKRSFVYLDDVMRIIHILTDLDSPAIAGFNNIKNQLQNYLLEAMDNYKFLLTIERHLKTLQMAKSFQIISQMLPNLMQGLKIIW